MSTKKPQIDLSKCNIGRSVRLRNGDIVQLEQYKRSLDWFVKTSTGFVYRKDGRRDAEKKTGYDIIAILPPAKAKKAVEPKRVGKKPDHLDPKWLEGEFDKQAIHRVIKLLKGLLNP